MPPFTWNTFSLDPCVNDDAMTVLLLVPLLLPLHMLSFFMQTAMSQLAGVDLVQSGAAGDIPVTVVAWAAPKIGNSALAARVDALHPKLRVLRVKNPADSVASREYLPGGDQRISLYSDNTQLSLFFEVGYRLLFFFAVCSVCGPSFLFFSFWSSFWYV